MERSGGTFRTTDEDFLTSDDPDFHPTDVTEDADGSLLVVETGAWYLHSCPVSRIAKPEIKGTIYRIRRKHAPRVVDPWGHNLKLETKSPEELARRLDDARPAVRDRAADLLVRAGESSIEALIGVCETHATPEVRAAAVFALAKIGTGRAPEAVRAALSDRYFLVRVAAARMVGLARDREAVPRLMQMVERDEPPVRRQAATALGQIGDPRAVPALVNASANPEDRIVEHSIIYSLITLRKPEPVVEALQSHSAKMRKAALIALDQMDNSPLRREQLLPELNSADAETRHAALWVASRHPEWSGEAMKVIQARLRKGDFPPEEADAVRQTLVAFCGNAQSQQVMAELLGDPDAVARQRLFLLDTMERCAVKEFPASWTAALRKQLHGRDAAVRARVVAVARSRQLAALDNELAGIAGDNAESNDIRIAALGALVSRRPALPDASFRFLLAELQPDTDADLRQMAAQILGRATLTEAQLLTLAREHLAQADPLILPHLLDAFRGVDAFRSSRSAEVGNAMVKGLLASSHPAEGVAAERIPELLKNFPGPVQLTAQPLLAQIAMEKQSRASRLKALEPLLKSGDIDRGREVFYGKKAGCASCHTIMAEGGDVGPDLTGVGAIRSGIDLLEAIVYPSASFVPGHEVYRVETANDVYVGVQGEGTPDAVVIISGPRDRVRIPRKDIRSIRPSAVSLMPDGFADNLSRQELANLLAFLRSQKSRLQASAR